MSAQCTLTLETSSPRTFPKNVGYTESGGKMPPEQNASQKKMPPGYFVTRKKKAPEKKKVISTCNHVTYETYNI